MSNEVESLTALVWQHAPSRYSGTHLVVLLKLAGLSSKEGHAWPSIWKLAAMCGVEERALQYVVKQLKKDKLLHVQHRKGHSNKFFLNTDGIKSLPPVVEQPEEQNGAETPKDAAQPTEAPPQPTTSDARAFAEKLHFSVSKEIKNAHIPEDWQSAWPITIQPLFDAGHDVELLKKVARFALDKEYWRDVHLANNAAHAFVANFPTLLEQYKNFGKVAA